MTTLHAAIKAAADWYYDGPGWIIMALVIAPMVGSMIHQRPRIWFPVFLVFVVLLPLALLLVRHSK